MAGNIIPAIATTNAVVAGLSALQALHLLRRAHGDSGMGALRAVHAQFKPAQPLASVLPARPARACGVCQDTYVLVRCDPARARLGALVAAVMGGDEREVSVFEGARVLAEPEWDDNLERTLESLGVTRGKFLSIVDDENAVGTLSLAICALP
jgi:ubiquitin-like 1-activating enzyme E1 B